MYHRSPLGRYRMCNRCECDFIGANRCVRVGTAHRLGGNDLRKVTSVFIRRARSLKEALNNFVGFAIILADFDSIPGVIPTADVVHVCEVLTEAPVANLSSTEIGQSAQGQPSCILAVDLSKATAASALELN